ncbi:hypothetical protein SAMN05443665_101714 [Actinomadura meyerae]|uniref:Core-binding (CB) domain-containing protein n=1 Tax=Actinomadura meyerae TaxID=240840 RepID=A0A239K6K0_9ACTN|nr:hypothetical protein [Actinomadura meyerae]SNT13631.1 hypothetical protein SAMN05443665_101714 [Actinomadura meyerae]
MAYAEKRGRYWRGRYKNPPGVRPLWGTVSEAPDGVPFTRRLDAEQAADSKEAKIREQIAEWRKLTAGRTPPPVDGITYDEWLRLLDGLRISANGGRDPNAGEVLLGDWIRDNWWPAQDLEPRSIARYEGFLNNMILLAFGERPVNTLNDPQEIAAWENELRGRYARSTVQNARSVLSTILGDAKEAGLVDVNAAARRRGRGRMTTRRHAKSIVARPREWATPLEALLIAERAALLSGRDDDLVMWVTGAWCGLRWGELIGLTVNDVRPGKLCINRQLSELRGRMTVAAPKYLSFRNDDPAWFGALDLPPFLQDLLAAHIERVPQEPCRCSTESCTGRFLFSTSRGGHPRHNRYSTRIWQPAVNGVYPLGSTRRQPPGPVLVDMAAGWPGRPLHPAWPYAGPGEWQPPRGFGLPAWDEPFTDALAMRCPVPTCGAGPCKPCRATSGRQITAHQQRMNAAVEAGHVRDRELAVWLPIKRSITPHGMRHSQKVWMDEDRIPTVLKHDRMGHAMPGIGGTYSHVSETMRERLVTALQTRWETALKQRAALCPMSPVPLLNDLLTRQ